MRLVIVCLLLSGCANMTKMDYAVQASLMADTLSSHAGQCGTEGGFITKDVIGENPSTQGRAGWLFARMFAYQMLSDKYGDRKWWPWVQWTIIGTKTWQVNENRKIWRDYGC